MPARDDRDGAGLRPKILLADEPTTALDVTVQAQIFALIEELVAETGCGVVFITHDLGAVAEMCDRVAVLYGGQLMRRPQSSSCSSTRAIRTRGICWRPPAWTSTPERPRRV